MKKNKSRLGFTLAEVLMVVAIIVILFALSVPAVASIQKNLRQKELDTKAETIYTAVQNRLSELYSSGQADLYDPTGVYGSFIHQLGYVPADYDSNDIDSSIGDKSVYYITNNFDGDDGVLNEEFINNLFGDSTLSEDLMNGHWAIEIIPYYYDSEDTSTPYSLTAASVYSVFYSEDTIDVSTDYSTNPDRLTNPYFASYRESVTKRKALSKSCVGYYSSASLAGGSSTNALKVPYINISSNELVNEATVWVKKPISISNNMVVEFTFTDTDGNKRTYYYRQTGYTTSEYQFSVKKTDGEEKLVDKDTIGVTYSPAGSIYKFVFTVDNLSKENLRFENLFGSGSNSEYEGKLKAGLNFTLDVKAYCLSDDKAEDGSISRGIATAYGNSIYAYTTDGKEIDDSTNKAGLNTLNSAYISNGRHLQNLDNESGVDSSITKAYLINDISFDTTSDFYKKYINNYYNGKTTISKIYADGSVNTISIPKFKSIVNNNLASFDGQYEITNNLGVTTADVHTIYNLGINNESSSGLFGSVSNNLTISNLNLIGSYIKGTNNAGGLVGNITSSGKLTINNVSLYLDHNNGDIPSSITSDQNLESFRFISANNAGGLVGSNAGNLTINSSFTSTNIGNNNSTSGGLVGNNTGTLNISKSYSDSYIYGNNVGGLVGSSSSNSLTIADSYAVGFVGISDSQTGAGLVNGAITSLSNSYSAISPYNIADDDGLDTSSGISNYTYYSIAKSVSANNSVYYEKGSINNSTNYGTQGVEGRTISDNFTNTSSLVSVSYNLLGKTLSGYPYPRLKNLEHYGDWDASFSKGSLVYYEAYTDGTYGFDGANVTPSIDSSNRTVKGDGYGVVFLSGNEPSGDITYTINGTTKTLSKSTKYTVNSNGTEYVIYPLDKIDINPTNKFEYYTNISVNFDSATKYFAFNPHFASSVIEKTTSSTSVNNPKTVYIRTARQLYNLSLYFTGADDFLGYDAILGDSVTYTQGRDIDYAFYDWSNYTNFGSSITAQEPIGQALAIDDTHENSFGATYNGNYYEIKNISFKGQLDYVGLFGYVDRGASIKNVFLVNQFDENGTKYYSKSTKTALMNEYISIGILAGYNDGTIDNCAVAGYYLDGDNIIKGYPYSNVYVGGLIGINGSNGTISNSTADLPSISLNMYQAYCYAGGLVGYNEGNINTCYALSYIHTTSDEGSTNIAGITGYNSGRITNVYSISSLNTEGTGAHVYMLAPAGSGGTVQASTSYYLNKGSYWFVEDLYSYTGNASTEGTGKSYDEIKKLATNKATTSKYNQVTLDYIENSKGTEEAKNANYPFNAVVKARDNKTYIHYGEWIVSPSLGNYGLFYWEYEEGEQNGGYHITYLGKSAKGIEFNSTLCDQHNDGGVITEYGYGYYTLKGYEDKVSISTDSNITINNSYVNTTAQKALDELLPEFTMYPYTTRYSTKENEDYIYLASDDINGKIILTYTDNENHNNDSTSVYYVSPFFGDSLSMYVDNTKTYEGKDYYEYLTSSTSFNRDALTSTDIYLPGSANHSYKIRSISQLQYINWNSSTHSYDRMVGTSDDDDAGIAKYNKFNYLMYTNITSGFNTSSNGHVTKTNAGNKYNQNLKFAISHDINADNVENYVPIAGQSTSSGTNAYNSILYAWFGSNFTGNSYKIQNLNIYSNSFTVGLFGVTAGANLDSIILYSEKGDNVICRGIYTVSNDKSYGKVTSDTGAYALGGIVGIAYDYGTGDSFKDTDRVITNCAIGGYTIIDNSTNTLTLGEANVGGLIGVSNTKINKCSAVVDIEINATHNGHASYGDFIRVGGIAGAAPNEVNNCYTGGSIKVGSATLNENRSSSSNDSYITYTKDCETDVGSVCYISNKTLEKKYSTHIYLSGIVGSGFAMNYSNFSGTTGLREGYPTVRNSYTYIDFPVMEGSIRSISMITSFADRANNTNYTSNKRRYEYNLTIDNCYFLDSSRSNIQYNLPTFKTKHEKDISTLSPSVASNTYGYGGTETLLEEMLDGKSSWLLATMSSYSGYNLYQSQKLTNNIIPISKSYDELKTIDTLLGSDWGHVTTTDSSGVSVKGRYSFPASTPYLLGKDYPMPTIITQNGSINVHYGRWGFDGPYFTQGIVTFDILDELNLTENETYAYYTLTLNNNEKTILINSVDSSVEDVLTITKYEANNDGTYSITVRAEKVGTSNVTVKFDQYNENGDLEKSNVEQSCTVNVTSNLNVTASQYNYVLDLGDRVSNFEVYAKSNNGKDYSNENIRIDDGINGVIQWQFTHDQDEVYIDDYDEGIDKQLTNKNKYSLTLKANSATIDITAYYFYNGTLIEGHNKVDITRNDIVGIAGANVGNNNRYTYNEAVVINIPGAEIFEGSNKDYSLYKYAIPNNSNSFFLYELNNNILTAGDSTNVRFAAYIIDENGEEKELENVEFIPSETITNIDSNGYKYLNFDVVYKTNDSTKLTDVIIEATVYDETYGNFYSLKLKGFTINPSPYVVSVDANGGSYDDETTIKEYDVNTVNTVSGFVKPSRTGYTLSHWSTGIDDPATGRVELDDNTSLYDKYGFRNGDINLYAIWTANKVNINYINDKLDDSLKTVTSIIEYDQQNVDIPSNQLDIDGSKFEGWFTSDGVQILKPDGAVINQSKLNELILDGAVTLYAHYSEYPTITFIGSISTTDLSIGVSKSAYVTEDVKSNNTIVSGFDTSYKSTGSTDTTYTLLGWYSGEDLVINADGTGVNNYLTNFGDENVTLYAKWQYTTYSDAYVLVDPSTGNFEDGETYMIVNSNSSGSGYSLGLNSNNKLVKFDINIKEGNIINNGVASNEKYILSKGLSSVGWHAMVNANSGTVQTFYLSINENYLFIENCSNNSDTCSLDVISKDRISTDPYKKSSGYWNYNQHNSSFDRYTYHDIGGRYYPNSSKNSYNTRYLRFVNNDFITVKSRYNNMDFFNGDDIYIYKLIKNSVSETNETGELPSDIILNINSQNTSILSLDEISSEAKEFNVDLFEEEIEDEIVVDESNNIITDDQNTNVDSAEEEHSDENIEEPSSVNQSENVDEYSDNIDSTITNKEEVNNEEGE